MISMNSLLFLQDAFGLTVLSVGLCENSLKTQRHSRENRVIFLRFYVFSVLNVSVSLYFYVLCIFYVFLMYFRQLKWPSGPSAVDFE